MSSMKKPTPSPMDPHSTLEPSPFSPYSACSSSYRDIEQNDSVSQSHASFFFCHSRSNGTEVSVVAPGSLHDPGYHESGYLSIPRQVQSMPNYQLHLCDPPNPHTYLPSEDLSLTHGQVPGLPFEDNPFDVIDAFHAARTRCGHHNAVPWGDTNPRMETKGIENYNPLLSSKNIHGVSGSSDLLESSPRMTADDLSSLYAGSYTPSDSEVQDDYADVISSPGEARGTKNPVEDATVQEPSQQSSTKKEKDKKRKRVQRSEDDQHFSKICRLLKISRGPKNTLAHRILVTIETLVERQEHDGDIRYRLEESEAEVAALREDLARASAEKIPGSHIAIKANTALGGLDRGAPRQSWP